MEELRQAKQTLLRDAATGERAGVSREADPTRLGRGTRQKLARIGPRELQLIGTTIRRSASLPEARRGPLVMEVAETVRAPGDRRISVAGPGRVSRGCSCDGRAAHGEQLTRTGRLLLKSRIVGTQDASLAKRRSLVAAGGSGPLHGSRSFSPHTITSPP